VVTPLRVLFFGTPQFAVPSLTALLGSTHRVVGVVTQPDRPRGRGQKVVPQPVKAAAIDHKLPILQPDRLKDEAFLADLRSWQPDLAVVAAYGRLLPQILLDLPRLGFINVHASLLPRWRGAAPIHRAVIAGDTETGITIMRVVLALDAGPILARTTTPIDEAETSLDVEQRLASAGGALLTETIDRLSAGPIPEASQDERLVTYATRLDRRDSPIDWTRSAGEIHNQIRGLHPWPLASAVLGNRRLLLRRSQNDLGGGASTGVRPQTPGSDPGLTPPPRSAPGTIVDVAADALTITTGSGDLRLLEIQPEGRRPMSVRDFLNGTHVSLGDRFV
jgi:methionyl-tRNA formyltransferase